MPKAILNSTRVRNKERFQLKNVAALSISNYSENEMIVTIGDVSETVAGYDTVNKYARIFNITGDNTYFDLDLTIETPAGAGNAVLRYKQVVIDNPKC